jgi:hypothetical protein
MFYYISYNYSEAGMGHPLSTRYPMGGGCGGIGDPWWVMGMGHGWRGVLPIVGVGMERLYPMGMYMLSSLDTDVVASPLTRMERVHKEKWFIKLNRTRPM